MNSELFTWHIVLKRLGFISYHELSTENTTFRLKKHVILQVNDAAVRYLLNIDYITYYWGGGGRGERRGALPLWLCWLAVIWPGAPTDSMGEVPIRPSFGWRGPLKQ
jgi:hypothetical protein